jgi:hypothetical protein
MTLVVIMSHFLSFCKLTNVVKRLKTEKKLKHPQLYTLFIFIEKNEVIEVKSYIRLLSKKNDEVYNDIYHLNIT